MSAFSDTVFGAACTRPAAARRKQTANSATAGLPAMSARLSAELLDLQLRQTASGQAGEHERSQVK